MFFLIFYYFSFVIFGAFFVMQEMINNKKGHYFLDDVEDDHDDYDYVEREISKKQETVHPKKEKYEDKYKINKEIVDDELSQEKIEQLYNCFILENTPNGNVLLLYNHKTSSFVYYSDSSIPYKYLNTIARKYVNTYRCKQLYINQEDEKEKNGDEKKRRRKKRRWKKR